MKPGRVLTSIVLLGALAAMPATANAQRRRDGSDRRDQQRAEQGDRQSDGGRAVARSRGDDRQREVQQQQALQLQQQQQRQAELNRQRNQSWNNNTWRKDNGRHNGWYKNNARVYGYPYYANRGYGPRTLIVPRYITPRVVTVVPYRPYVYRPHIGLGVLYGTSGLYPYGYTPRAYYDPLPGRPYGGLRITDAPREAQVFADGYYVGIVNDFDGIFQHLNLEAGPHSIEIRLPGYNDAIQFDVVIQPGQTITYRADWN